MHVSRMITLIYKISLFAISRNEMCQFLCKLRCWTWKSQSKCFINYGFRAIGPSSPADWTPNLENHASRSSNNQQALMGSVSLCICPSLLQCPGGNVHHACHSLNHSSLERSSDENSESGFSWTYCTPVSDMSILVLPHDPCSYLLLYFIGSL